MHNRLKALLIDTIKSLEAFSQQFTAHGDETIKQRAYKAYMEEVIKQLQTIRQRLQCVDSAEDYAKAIEMVLGEIWQRTKGTLLSYTALPESEATRQLTILAVAVAHHRCAKPTIIEVMSLLMPGVVMTSMLTPEEVGLVDLAPLPRFKANVNDALRFFKTHVLSHSARFVIPVWYLLDDKAMAAKKRVNYFFDYQHHRPEDAFIDEMDIARLAQHSSWSLSLTAAKRHYQLLKSEDTHLLGQLLRLSAELYANSCEGVGREEVAGRGGNVAIGLFLRYYQRLGREISSQLPQALLTEIDKLERCYHFVDEDGKPRIAHIETCLATRRTALLQAIDGHESCLAAVTINQEDKVIELEQALLAVKRVKQQCAQALLRGTYRGDDKLPLTMPLIHHYKLSLTVKSFRELMFLMDSLSHQELSLCLASDDAALKLNWVEAIDSLENLLMFIVSLSNEKLKLVLALLKETLKLTLPLIARDYYTLLKIINNDKKRILIEALNLVDEEILARPHAQTVLVYALKEPALFKLLLDYVPKERLADVLLREYSSRPSLISTLVGQLDLLKVIFELIPEADYLRCLTTISGNGNSLLHRATIDAEAFKFLYALIPKKKRLSCLRHRNENNQLLFHLAVQSAPSLRLIIETIPLSELRQLQNECDPTGFRAIHFATKTFEALSCYLSTYPVCERLLATQVLTNDGWSPLSRAIHDFKCLQTLLNLYPKEQRLAAIKQHDTSGQPLIFLSLEYPSSCELIFSFYPPEERFQVLKSRTIYQQCLMAHACDVSSAAVLTLIRLLPPSQRLDCLLLTHKEMGVWPWFEKYPENIAPFFESLELDERLRAVALKNASGKSFLHLVTNDADTLKRVVSLIPSAKRFEALMVTNIDKETVFDLVALNSLCFVALLSMLCKKDKINLYRYRNQNGKTIFHTLLRHPQLFKVGLESLSLQSRFELLSSPNKFGRTLLHQAFNYPLVIKIILESVPQRLRCELLQCADKNGDSPMHLAMRESLSFLTILDTLTDDGKLQVFNTRDDLNKPLIHKLVLRDKLFKHALKKVTEPRRAEVLKLVDERGMTVMHRITRYLSTLKSVLRCLSESSRQQVLAFKNADALSVLETASATSLRVIYSFLAQHQRYNDADLVKPSEAASMLSLCDEAMLATTRALVAKKKTSSRTSRFFTTQAKITSAVAASAVAMMLWMKK